MLTLSGPIEKIRASYSQSEDGVSAVKYYKGGNSKTYGTLLSSFKEWTFTDSKILLGLHGRINSSNKITQLGFITNDHSLTVCPSSDPGTTTETTTETTTPDGETSGESTTETSTGTATSIVTSSSSGVASGESFE